MTDVVSGELITIPCELILKKSSTLKLVPGPKSKIIVSTSSFLIKDIIFFTRSESIFALPGLSPALLIN